MDKSYIEKEKERIESLKRYEYEGYLQGFTYIAGVDEVGRGSIAGPVVTGAVILPRDFFLPGINDSKKLGGKKRIELAGQIKKEAISWAVAYVFPSLIDRINILNATRYAMQLAVGQLFPVPDLVLTDAVKIPDINTEQVNIVKGDSLSVSIACASIIAKVERDKAMEAYDFLYPGYGFAEHKGYATKKHLEALMDKGFCVLHRKSFQPVKSMVSGGEYAQPSLFK